MSERRSCIEITPVANGYIVHASPEGHVKTAKDTYAFESLTTALAWLKDFFVTLDNPKEDTPR